MDEHQDCNKICASQYLGECMDKVADWLERSSSRNLVEKLSHWESFHLRDWLKLANNRGVAYEIYEID